MIYDPKQPRHLWKVGRVMKLIISDDEEVRGAEIKTGKTGIIIKRPVSKLYPIVTDIRDTDNRSPNDESSCTDNISLPIRPSSPVMKPRNMVDNSTVIHGVDSRIGTENKEINASTSNVDSLNMDKTDERVRCKAAILGELRRKKVQII